MPTPKAVRNMVERKGEVPVLCGLHSGPVNTHIGGELVQQYVYVGADPAQPALGDLRVYWRARWLPQEMTVFAQGVPDAAFLQVCAVQRRCVR